MNGREEIVACLTRKWTTELDYRLVKELWVYAANRIAVRFADERHDDPGQWVRSYGNENWEFDKLGLLRRLWGRKTPSPVRLWLRRVLCDETHKLIPDRAGESVFAMWIFARDGMACHQGPTSENAQSSKRIRQLCVRSAGKVRRLAESRSACRGLAVGWGERPNADYNMPIEDALA